MDPNPSLAPQLSSRKLSVVDLRWVMKKYYEHRNEWYNIGIALLIDVGTLDAIQLYRHERCDECFRDMLLTWLRSSRLEKPATELQLINATRKVRVNSLIWKFCVFLLILLVVIMVAYYHYEYLSVMNRTNVITLVTVTIALTIAQATYCRKYSVSLSLSLLPALILLVAFALYQQLYTATNIIHRIADDQLLELSCTEHCGSKTLLLDRLRHCAVDKKYFRFDENDMCPVLDWEHNGKKDIIQTTVTLLRQRYKKFPNRQFNLLRSEETRMPFLEVVMKDRYGKDLSLNDLVSILSGEPGHYVITGSPGCGKTTLMGYLAKEWAEKRALKSCDILFNIYLGSVSQTETINSLTSLLRASQFEDYEYEDIAKIINAKNGSGACFLLDAYDEYNVKFNYIYDLIFQNVLPHSLCVSTSRAFSEKNLEESIKLLGFPITNLSEYLHNVTNDAEVIASIEALWKKSIKMKELCTLPMHFSMILLLTEYRHSKLLPLEITMTKIYTGFMNATIIHYPDEYYDELTTQELWQCITNNIITAHNDLCLAFMTLHEAAFKMIFEGVTSFMKMSRSLKAIRKLGFVNAVIVPRKNSKEGFQIESEKVRFEFSHQTFQEFFAAVHLSTLPISEQLAFISVRKQEVLGFSTISSMVVQFYFGLIGDVYRDKVPAVSPMLAELILNPHHELSNFLGEQERFDVCNAVLDIDRLHLLKEIGWPGIEYRMGIESALLVSNSSALCIPFWLKMANADRLLNSLFQDKWNLTFVLYDSAYTSTFEGWNHTSQSFTEFVNNLWPCMAGILNPHDSVCHKQIFPTISSLRLHFYYIKASILLNLIQAFPNLRSLTVKFRLYMSDVFITDLNTTMQYIKQKHSNFSTDVLYGTLEHVAPQVEPYLQLRINVCILQANEVSKIDAQDVHLTMMDEFQCSMDVETIALFCRGNKLQYLTIDINETSHVEALVKCLNQAKYLLKLKINYYFVGAKESSTHLLNIFKHLPHSLQSLILNMNGLTFTDDEAMLFSEHLNRSLYLNSLYIYNSKFTSVGVVWLADALSSKMNLRTLALTVNDIHDIIPLTNITTLIHLYLDIPHHHHTIDMDSTLTVMLEYLKHLTSLKSFNLKANCSDWRDSDKIRVVSQVFSKVQIPIVSICLCNLSMLVNV
jgi:ABC-type multidrug transport system fused ATPase/permease subunit